MPRTCKPYVGCNAGITHFHADPHGKASICTVGRDPQVDLIAEGAGGLRRLADAADLLLTWHGGCAGCTLQKSCGTCMPLASLYRQGHPGPRGRRRAARQGDLPALLWHFDDAGWNVLGYQYALGRHADYSPDHPTSTGWCSSWRR
jgi:hypothetical protein